MLFDGWVMMDGKVESITNKLLELLVPQLLTAFTCT
jgi:hypothetical protein